MLSRPNQNDAGATPASRLVAAIEAVWTEIRRRHPDVPDVIVTVGAGSIGTPAGRLRLGHYANARWHPAAPDPGAATAAERTAVAELFVAGEGLARGAVDVLGTLLHEAAHGVATTRAIKDTSRAGAYHNRRYRELATELGLTVERDQAIGWSITRVPAATAASYRAEVRQLRDAIAHVRASEHHARHAGPGAPPAGGDAGDSGEQAGGRRSAPTYTCACQPPRRLRMAPTVHALAPVICGACEQPFST